jgi:hypothetical protein
MANTLRQLKRATEIVERYRKRGNVFPREFRDCGRGDPESQQEYRDACKVKTWKYSLLGKNMYNCSDEIRDYLDENMPGWRDRVYSHHGKSSVIQMQKAEQIVERYHKRGNVLPRRLKDPTKAQETKDAICISTWKSSLKGYNRTTCSKELCSYLDENMPGWRLDHHKSKPRSQQGKEKALRAMMAGTTTSELEKLERSTEVLMPLAKDIVARFHANNKQYPSLKLKCRQDPARAQEYSDAKRLHDWKSHVDKAHAPEVFEFLDREMPNWKNSHVPNAVTNRKNTPISKAREIFKRCSMRNGNFPRLIPSCDQVNPELILENRDAMKLREWKISYLEKPRDFCPALRDFLNTKLPSWFSIDVDSPLHYGFPTPRTETNRVKRKMSPDNDTDEEVVSTDGSNVGSDDGERFHYNDMGSLKKMRTSQLTTNSDESASVAALLQLGSAPNPFGTTYYSPPIPTPTFFSGNGGGSMMYAPAPLIPQYAGSFTTYAQGSTYGNGCRSQQSPLMNQSMSSYVTAYGGGM